MPSFRHSPVQDITLLRETALAASVEVLLVLLYTIYYNICVFAREINVYDKWRSLCHFNM